MVNVLGQEVPLNINISGFLSSSWIYVFIVAVLGLICVVTVALILFYRTYNRKVIVFDNIAGQGYQPAFRSRARIIKLGVGGAEILKTLAGGNMVSAYGRKMGKNTYWFTKGPDGYWYNSILGDFDTKTAMLDIEPVDRDVRMTHVAIDKQARAEYDKKGNIEKYIVMGILFFMLIAWLVGMYVIAGRIQTATAPLAAANAQTEQAAKTNAETSKLMAQTSSQLADIAIALGAQIQHTNKSIEGGTGDSGLVPVS